MFNGCLSIWRGAQYLATLKNLVDAVEQANCGMEGQQQRSLAADWIVIRRAAVPMYSDCGRYALKANECRQHIAHVLHVILFANPPDSAPAVTARYRSSFSCIREGIGWKCTTHDAKILGKSEYSLSFVL